MMAKEQRMLALRMRPERSGDLESKSGRTMRYMPAIGEETRQTERGGFSMQMVTSTRATG